MDERNEGTKHADPRGSGRSQSHNPSWSDWVEDTNLPVTADVLHLVRQCRVCGLFEFALCKHDKPLRELGPHGCCDACHGTGGDPHSIETNGQCWDCRGTGHPHEGPCDG